MGQSWTLFDFQRPLNMRLYVELKNSLKYVGTYAQIQEFWIQKPKICIYAFLHKPAT